MSEGEGRPRHGVLLLVASAVGLTALFFHRVLLSGEMFSARDSLYVYLPVFKAWTQSVLAGRFPEWLSIDGLGQPFVGTLVVAPLHPTKLLYLLFPLDVGFTLNILVCFPLALLGVHALARLWEVPRAGALLAGLAYAFSGYLVCITNNLCYLMAAATVPWALWAAERQLRAPGAGRLLAAGGLLALVLYAGDVQAFTVTCGLLPLLALSGASGTHRPRLVSALGTLAVAALLAAPQLLSSLSLLGMASAGADSLGTAQEYALHPLRLLEPLLGSYFLLPGKEPWVPVDVVTQLVPSGYAALWVDSIHLGAPALLLAGVGLWHHRRAWPLWLWGGVWLLLVGLALGPSLPLYEAVHHLVPPWRLFRYPSKLVPFLLLGAALASAFGWRALFSDLGAGRRLFFRLAAGVMTACLLLAALEAAGHAFTVGLLLPRWPGMPPEVADGLSSRFVSVCLLAAAACAVCAGAMHGALGAGRAQGLLLAAQFLTSLLTSEPLYELLTPEVLSTPPPFADAILSQPRALPPVPARVASHFNVSRYSPEETGLDARQLRSLGMVLALEPDTPALWGMESAEPLLPAASKRVRGVTADLTRWFVQWAPLFSVEYSVHYFSEWPPLEAAGKKLVAADRVLGAVLVSHPGALPRAFLAHPRCVASAGEALNLLSEPAVLSGQLAAVECGGLALSPPAGATSRVEGQVRVERYEAGLLSLEVESGGDAVLVINDAWFPGWSATVDGAPAPILPANSVVRAVPVKAGRHQVVLTYRDAGLRLGLGVAALTCAVLLGLAWARRRPRLSASARA